MMAVALHVWVDSAGRQPASVAPRTNGPIFSTVLPLPASPVPTQPSPKNSRRVEIERTWVRIPRTVPVAAFTPASTLKAQLRPVGTTGSTPLASLAPRRIRTGGLPESPAGRPASETLPLAAPAGVTPVASRDWSVPLDAPLPSAPRPADEVTKDQEETVIAVLNEYRRAYGHLDVRATKAVYPSIDDRGLERAFRELREQQLRFASCGVKISSSGAGANAWCRGEAAYRPKVGGRILLTDRQWTFSLARHGSGWQILDARMQ